MCRPTWACFMTATKYRNTEYNQITTEQNKLKPSRLLNYCNLKMKLKHLALKSITHFITL